MTSHSKFSRGDFVRKKSGSEWAGLIVGEYSTTLTPEGYAVESAWHPGSVQIYPAAALKLMGQIATVGRCLVGGRDINGFKVPQAGIEDIARLLGQLRKLLDEYDRRIMDGARHQ